MEGWVTVDSESDCVDVYVFMFLRVQGVVVVVIRELNPCLPGSQKIVPEIERSRNRNRKVFAFGEKEIEVGSERLKFLMTSVRKYLIL